MDYSAVSQTSYQAPSPVFWIVYILLILFYAVCAWKIYVKANKPGWASIVPFYNLYVMLQIIQKPTWWMILFLLPFVNIVMIFVLGINLARVFGKSTVFGVLFLSLFNIIGYPILAFGKSTYTGGSTPPPAPGITEPTPPAPVSPTPPTPTTELAAAAPSSTQTPPTEEKK